MTKPWIKLLADECGKTSQRDVGARIGYSSATVSMVLKGTYKGDIKAVESAVLKKLTRSQVNCPVLGEITPAECSSNQCKPFSASSSLRVRLFQACRTCPNNTKRRD